MTKTEEQHWASLLRAGLSGDEHRYKAFLDAITPALRRLVRAKAGGLDPADCEDILQDILLAVHLKRHVWRSDEPVRPWLFAIARHKVIDAFRARGRRVTVDIESFSESLAAPDQEDPTRAGDMERVLAELDDRSAAIVRGVGLDGESVGEVGTRLGMSEGAVRVALHRGLKKLASLRARMLE